MDFCSLTIACRTHTATGLGSRKGRLSHLCSLRSSDLIIVMDQDTWRERIQKDRFAGVRLDLMLTCVEASNSLRDNPLEVVDHRVGHWVGGDVPK